MITLAQMLKSAAKIDETVKPGQPRVIKKPEPITPYVNGAALESAADVTQSSNGADKAESEDNEAESDALFDVYKVVDGEQNKRPSKANVPMDEAQAYVDERPDNEYVILPDKG